MTKSTLCWKGFHCDWKVIHCDRIQYWEGTLLIGRRESGVIDTMKGGGLDTAIALQGGKHSEKGNMNTKNLSELIQA